MAERVATEEGRDLVRAQREREYLSLQAKYHKVVEMDDGKKDVPFSRVLLKERQQDIRNLFIRISIHFKSLSESETDDEKIQADEDEKQLIITKSTEAMNLCTNLLVWKDVTPLIESVSEGLDAVDSIKAADPELDVTGCLHDIKEEVNKMNAYMSDFTGDHADPLWTNVKALRLRLLKATAMKRPMTAAVIPTKLEEPDFKIPKMNIPKFKGGLESWHGFWSRYKVAVHENEKLTDPVKLAVLIDLITDPTLNEYLIAANDGQPDRYNQVITYLQSRFDRPKELHALYLKKLVDLPPNKGTPAELSQAADTVFAAVSGIRRSGQITIDSIATSLIISTLPPWLRMEWENKTESEHEVPNVDKWIEFMRKRAVTAEHNLRSTYSSTNSKKEQSKPKPAKVHVTSTQPAANTQQPAANQQSSGDSGSTYRRRQKGPRQAASGNQPKCSLCPQSHFLYQCTQFMQMAARQRKSHVESNNFCGNCLKLGHTQQQCNSHYTCRVCGQKHNTLLHIDATASSTIAAVSVSVVNPALVAETDAAEEKILMTSQILITGADGKMLEARAMLDTGASISVISKRMISLLKLKPNKEMITVSGIESSSSTPARPTAVVQVTSKTNPAWSTYVKVVILPRTTRNLPENPLPPKSDMPHLKELVLADPKYHEPRRVDMILDVGVFSQILLSGKIEGTKGHPSAWETQLGWGVMGCYAPPIPGNFSGGAINSTVISLSDQDNLNTLLERFWFLENMPRIKNCFSSEELAIQKHYDATHYFSKSLGRYVVSLPRKDIGLSMGESYTTALNRFFSNEKSLIRRGTWAQFQEVLMEYLKLGHAQLVTAEELCTPEALSYYLPMHAVYKHSSSSTKMRIVFDGSCSSSTGVSLNDILAAGPTIQPNLDQILVRFRAYGIALSADITKMYREVVLSSEDRQLHRFLWRPHPSEPVAVYCMNRVTFGITSSPYVAIRTLHQIAKDFSTPDSIITHHIQQSFYVDDMLAGGEEVSSVIKLYEDMRATLLKGGYALKKWRTSSDEVLQRIPKELQEVAPDRELEDSQQSVVNYQKTLGIAWDSNQDIMKVRVISPTGSISTKKGVVSDTAKCFDVLGWLAPFIINMKVLFQKLWKIKLDWKEILPDELAQEHKQWRDQLESLESVAIPRCYFIKGRRRISTSLHGFSDASTKAYAAVIYIRAVYSDGEVSCKLVMAKTKVAPLKTISIPRLELCAAEKAAELLSIIGSTLEILENQRFGWCDSTIALAWLRGKPSRYKTFVANRVATAASHLSQGSWLHVPTTDNPADCASRGVTAEELISHQLWWEGPPWMRREPMEIPSQPGEGVINAHQNEEVKQKEVMVVKPSSEWQSKFHSYIRLLHCTAYLLRFFNNLKAAVAGQAFTKDPMLAPSEVDTAEIILFKDSQKRVYQDEIKRLSSSPPKEISKSSPLRLVHPILDEKGLLLVGGRLGKANIHILQKHPVILAAKDHTTKLLFHHFHKLLSHCGPSLLLSHIGEKVYVLGAKKLARNVCQNCIYCKRYFPKSHQQKMGQLPAPRVNPSFPFLNTGVDYAGPFWLKSGHPRRPIRVKGYLAVFVCLSTKAIHLEVVSSLTTQAFISTLKRFISRRNLPQHIFSDNGLNFIGARNELADLYNFLSLPATQTAVKEELLIRRITWHCIPDRAPHFGGIWEAGVKSAKRCLKGAVGTTALTYEEATTVFCQTEAILNSRPYINQESHDPAGEMPLTSGHFLTGRAMKAFPEIPENPNLKLTDRWKLCRSIVQEFWNTWTKEYLSTLQKSKKWHHPQPNVKVGDIVMVLDDTELLSEWKIGKVISVSPGEDQLVRAAEVLVKKAAIPKYPRSTTLIVDPVKVPIKTSIIKRPIVKLAPILTADEELNDRTH